MCRGGKWEGEIQDTQETEQAIPVTKRPRKHDPGTHQCCHGGSECVEDQDRTLPLRGRRRSSARAEDMMTSARQKRPRTLDGRLEDRHKVPYQAGPEGCAPDGNSNSHDYGASSRDLALALPAKRRPGDKERQHHVAGGVMSYHGGGQHQRRCNEKPCPLWRPPRWSTARVRRLESRGVIRKLGATQQEDPTQPQGQSQRFIGESGVERVEVRGNSVDGDYQRCAAA